MKATTTVGIIHPLSLETSAAGSASSDGVGSAADESVAVESVEAVESVTATSSRFAIFVSSSYSWRRTCCLLDSSLDFNSCSEAVTPTKRRASAEIFILIR